MLKVPQAAFAVASLFKSLVRCVQVHGWSLHGFIFHLYKQAAGCKLKHDWFVRLAIDLSTYGAGLRGKYSTKFYLITLTI